ncbi:MAG: PQQ-binding-like beta-propeller repeat protein [candidate division Zixibacteria bacterium]|nr:PQQ-binding-like beta-propeller repeat protein [candidate division Zixibacteria bacterium]MBU1471014.1 PQQ-binding-like beta-propeller repeat protein [candidate division Zixibacteria bacterium]MBU2625049.1 PQQ-binding-like beta-propeller repeat protein [candidate division Zixibacteria bacterium]
MLATDYQWVGSQLNRLPGILTVLVSFVLLSLSGVAFCETDFDLVETIGIEDKPEAMVIANLDSDPETEFVVVLGWSGIVKAYDNDGTILWTQTTGWYGSINAGNLDGDPMDEIAVSSADHHLYVYDDDGSVICVQAIDRLGHDKANFADIDGDGDNELVFSEWDSSVYSASPAKVYAFDPETCTIIWTYTLPDDAVTHCSDIDGDGAAEIVASSRGDAISPVMVLLEGDGTPVWTKPGQAWTVRFCDMDGDNENDLVTNVGGISAYNYDGVDLFSSSAKGFLVNMFDLDGDGEMEFLGIGLSSRDSIYATNLDGTELWSATLSSQVGYAEPISLGTGSTAGVTAALRDGDSLFVLSGLDGSVLWKNAPDGATERFRIPSGSADFDGDGLTDMIVGNDNDLIYMFHQSSSSTLLGWPTLCHDLQHTGSTSDSLQPPLTLLDSFTVSTGSASFLSGEVIVDGMAYVGGISDCVYAYDLTTNEIVWDFCDSERRIRTPCVTGEYVYVTASKTASSGSRLYKLDKGTGALVDFVDVPGEPEPPCVANGIVYVGYSHYWSGPFGLLAVDANDLHTLWNYTNPTNHGFSQPAVSDDGSRLFVSDGGGRLLCLDAATGVPSWSFSSGHSWGVNTPTYHNSTVYMVAGYSNINVYALDESNGNLYWQKHLVSAGYPSQTQALYDGKFFVSANETLYALDCDDNGEIIWTFQRDGGCYSPSVASGIVYVSTDSPAKLYALNAYTGDSLWCHSSGQTGPQMSGPAIDGGHLVTCFSNSNQWSVYHYTADLPIPPISAETEMTPDPVYIYWEFAMDPKMDTIYVGNFSGGYSASDVDTTSLLLNGSIAPIEVNTVPAMSGYTGEVLELIFPLANVISCYPPPLDTTIQDYTVTAQLNDDRSLSASGSFTFIGKIRGDVNYDMHVNLLDITVLASYIFKSGNPPCPIESGDADLSGDIDIDDVVSLIAYIYCGEPWPARIEHAINSEAKDAFAAAQIVVIPEDSYTRSSQMISVDSRVAVRGYQFEFEGADFRGVSVRSFVPGMELFYGIVDGRLKVGLFDIEGQAICPSGNHDVIEVESAANSRVKLLKTILASDGGGSTTVIYRDAFDQPVLPSGYKLNQNYPNPFNPVTMISFYMHKAGNYTLTVYNVVGQIVDKIEGTATQVGEVSVEWDGHDKASGIYFYKLDTEGFSETKKMALVK